MNIIVPQMIPILGRWETSQLKAYPDNDGTWHVGFGHGNANGFPPFVDEHTVLRDEAEAMNILIGEISQFSMPQLVTLLDSAQIKVNDYQFSALLDATYNRGIGRVRDSIALRFLQYPDLKDYTAWAAKALVFSSVGRFIHEDEKAREALDAVNGLDDHFEALDVAKDKKTKIERIHLGLTLRRQDDSSLFLHKEK